MQKIKAHKQVFRCALRILYWVGLMILYLCAASRPGVWLRDAFLYRQTDGSFAGRDEYGIYALTVTAAEHETQAVFAMNGGNDSIPHCNVIAGECPNLSG